MTLLAPMGINDFAPMGEMPARSAIRGDWADSSEIPRPTMELRLLHGRKKSETPEEGESKPIFGKCNGPPLTADAVKIPPAPN